jgi:hypothetical protein
MPRFVLPAFPNQSSPIQPNSESNPETGLETGLETGPVPVCENSLARLPFARSRERPMIPAIPVDTNRQNSLLTLLLKALPYGCESIELYICGSV